MAAHVTLPTPHLEVPNTAGGTVVTMSCISPGVLLEVDGLHVKHLLVAHQVDRLQVRHERLVNIE